MMIIRMVTHLLAVTIQTVADIGEVVGVSQVLDIGIATTDKPSPRFGRRVEVLHDS